MGGDMELVRQFNNELSSICESKPPVSKAKMASITRLAVKALKHYKHIVHSVEKFLQKCRSEYKVAALYVLDSIIRQSRHQFGPDKDLFGPRFQKNLKFLFQNIFQCPQEDKPKVVRVLNLWQKNTIYSPEVISPLIDMASTPSKVLAAAVQRHKNAKAAHNQSLNDESVHFNDPFEVEEDGNDVCKAGVQMSQEDEIKVLKAQLEQQKKHQELLQQQLQMQVLATRQQNLQFQLQQSQVQPNPLSNIGSQQFPTALSQQVAQLNPLLNQTLNPQLSILSHIHDLTVQLEKDKATLALLASSEDNVQPNSKQAAESQFLENFQQLIQTAKGFIQKDPRQHCNNDNIIIPKSIEDNTTNKQALMFDYKDDENKRGNSRKYHHVEEHPSSITASQLMLQEEEYGMNEGPPQKKPLIDLYEDQLQKTNYEEDDDAMQIDNDDEIHLIENQQHVSRWQSFPEQAQHNQDSPRLRSRTDSRLENDSRLQGEQRREQRNIMPPPMKNRVTVASVTLWVGRLPKNCSPDVIHDTFLQYGEIKSIDLIEARGCAFVTMKTRVEAERALRHLKHKRIDGYDVKMAWGQAKGLQLYSKFWDENFGCAYIPCELVKEQDLPALLEGSIIDESTLPGGITLPNCNSDESSANSTEMSIVSDVLIPHPFIMPPGSLPPPGIGIPGFRGQFPPPLHQILPMSFRPPPPNMIPMQGSGPLLNNNNSHLQVPDDLPRDPRDLLKQLHPQFQTGMSSLGPLPHCEFGTRPPFQGRPPVLPGEPPRHIIMPGERFGSPQLHGERPPFERHHWFLQENRFNNPRLPQDLQASNPHNFNIHFSDQNNSHTVVPISMQGPPMSVRGPLQRLSFNGPVSSWEPRKEQGITQLHFKEQSSFVNDTTLSKNDKADHNERKPNSPNRSRDDRDQRSREAIRNYRERDMHKNERKEKDRREDRNDRDGRRDERNERDGRKEDRGRKDDHQNRIEENRNDRRDRNGRDDFGRDDRVRRSDHSRERRNHSQDSSLNRPCESILQGKSPLKLLIQEKGLLENVNNNFEVSENSQPLAFESLHSQVELINNILAEKKYDKFAIHQDIDSKTFVNEQEISEADKKVSNLDNDGDDLYDPLAVCETSTPSPQRDVFVDQKADISTREDTFTEDRIKQMVGNDIFEGKTFLDVADKHIVFKNEGFTSENFSEDLVEKKRSIEETAIAKCFP